MLVNVIRNVFVQPHFQVLNMQSGRMNFPVKPYHASVPAPFYYVNCAAKSHPPASFFRNEINTSSAQRAWPPFIIYAPKKMFQYC
jgi:hypothetical protein